MATRVTRATVIDIRGFFGLMLLAAPVGAVMCINLYFIKPYKMLNKDTFDDPALQLKRADYFAQHGGVIRDHDPSKANKIAFDGYEQVLHNKDATPMQKDQAKRGEANLKSAATID